MLITKTVLHLVAYLKILYLCLESIQVQQMIKNLIKQLVRLWVLPSTMITKVLLCLICIRKEQ